MMIISYERIFFHVNDHHHKTTLFFSQSDVVLGVWSGDSSF